MAIAWSKVNKIKYIEHSNFYEGIMPDGKSFYIDKEDFEFVSNNYWHYLKDDYYLKSTKHGLMHRAIMKDVLEEGMQVDHINRNRLDNRKINLRVVTQQENLQNKSVYKSNKSGYPGVKWNKKLGKWQVQITRNKKRVHLGVFDELQDAVVARKKAE